MIIQDSKGTVEKIGGGQSHTFSIHVSRKAFQILSDLYSDKPLAIMRELGCNAFDSHVSADKADLPISIHLPNNLEPFLEIRDFGTGISPEDIFKVYSSYFTSTKTGSNDTVGCLGLGSKSPFAYVDNFAITVRYNGVKRLYLAFFDEGGAPTITLADEQDDCEGNGVAIQIPIKKEDANKFRAACMSAFRWFAVKPTVTGAAIDWSEIERTIILKGNGWRIVSKDKNDYRSDSGSFAIMGGVNYPIDKNKVRSDLQCVLCNTIIEFPIGDLDFAPSREALSYDDRTVQKLNERIATIKKEIADDATKSISQAKYLDDAARVYVSLPSYAQNALGKFTWKNGVLDHIRIESRSLTKVSYRKNLRTSKSSSMYLQELAKLKGITYVQNKPNDMWKIREEMDVKGLNSVIIIGEFEQRALLDAGVNPDNFINTKDLNYIKTNTSVSRQVDKEVVGVLDGSQSTFTSKNLREAINDGVEYYCLKNGNNHEAIIKGKTLDKDGIKGICANFYKTLVMVAPTKEKLAIAAGLTKVDEFIDDELKDFDDSLEGKRLIALTPISIIQYRTNDKKKAIVDIALGGSSNLAKMIVLSEEKAILTKQFDTVIRIWCRLSDVIKTNVPPVEVPTLTALEKHLIDEMSDYYSDSVGMFQAYEELAAKVASAKILTNILTPLQK